MIYNFMLNPIALVKNINGHSSCPFIFLLVASPVFSRVLLDPLDELLHPGVDPGGPDPGASLSPGHNPDLDGYFPGLIRLGSKI